MKVNLHTHTYRCKHATGTDEEYVKAAIEIGLTKLGFSDHTPFPYENGFVNKDKMDLNQLDEYIDSIHSLKEKYKDQIEILVGLECEPVPRFLSFLQETRKKLDYMILGNHGDPTSTPHFMFLTEPEQLWMYVEYAVRGLESGLYLYLAHPDAVFNSYPKWDENARRVAQVLCRESKRMNIPLEYNLYGVLKGKPEKGLGYPCDEFWKVVAEENCKAVIGYDAHRPEMFHICDADGAYRKLTAMGIEVLEDPTQI